MWTLLQYFVYWPPESIDDIVAMTYPIFTRPCPGMKNRTPLSCYLATNKISFWQNNCAWQEQESLSSLTFFFHWQQDILFYEAFCSDFPLSRYIIWDKIILLIQDHHKQGHSNECVKWMPKYLEHSYSILHRIKYNKI